MATVELSLTEEELQALMRGDRGLRELMESSYNEVLEAEMTEHLGAEPDERTEDREGYRNGHYTRSLVTRVGPLTLRVPRSRDGTFSTKIFQRYQRSEKALVLALMEMLVNGVSTRKVKRVTEELCGREFSKSTVSRLAKGLNEQVEAWNERSLEGTRYPFVLVDAMHIKVRRQGAVRSTSALIAVGVNEEGYREILGLRIANSETEEGWLETFRWLKGRGLEGVELVVSDAHEGLTEALHRCFQGATWQRCQTHFRRNILDKTPAEWKDAMQEGLDRVFEAEDPEAAREHFEALAAELEGEADDALDTLEEGLEDAIAVLRLPAKYRQRLRTTNTLERLIQELRRREKVVRIFPNDESAWRLLGAFLAETHEDWSTGRRYFRMEEYFRWKQQQQAADSEIQPAA
ncbi:MAG: IS256 family transposase [Gemmatimonadota bacterium]